MREFVFRCSECEFLFRAEGEYSQFDQARKCVKCGSPAFMLVDGMARFDFCLAAEDRAAYAEHNMTFTGEFREGEGSIGFTPNSHADQCQCEKCFRHRKRALVTEVADKGRDVRLCP